MIAQLIHSGSVRAYYPEQALQLVHRTKWSRKHAVLAESQGDLFRRMGEL